MASVHDATRSGRFGAGTSRPSLAARPSVPQGNSIPASQARAALRRAARRDEQAVATWLRELAGRTR